MKKRLLMTFFIVTFFAMTAISTSAVVNDTVKVGLRYGNTSMFSANLENAEGSGYEFGYFTEKRVFESVGWTKEIAISMTAASDIYMNQNGTYSADMPNGVFRHLGPWHVELTGYRSFDETAREADKCGGYPAWINSEYVVRIGSYPSEKEAADAASKYRGSAVVRSSDTGVLVTVTRTNHVLFEFDASGACNLAVQPQNGRGEPVTWFKGYQYAGAFEYPRVTGGNLNVFNVVDLEEYVKGVIPYEMNSEWSLEALKAQAVCARTYACRNSKHLAVYGFDLCNTTDCQVYYGRGSGGASPSRNSNRAVEETAGEKIYYQGLLVQDAVYHSSDGGATENAENVWGSDVGYLQGKKDPYEKQINIPNYEWSVTYTADELTWILDQKGYHVGTVSNVYVSEYTPLGNVKAVTFEGSRGTKTVRGDTCRTIFYSSTYRKSVKSMRFDINGGTATGGTIHVNQNGTQLSSLENISVISGRGALGTLKKGPFQTITASGISPINAGEKRASAAGSKGEFVITGSGNGHNVGMSQYGAKAMAELGHDYREILEFYYTDVTIR